MARHQYHFRVRRFSLYLRDDVDPGAVRQAKIGDDEIELSLVDYRAGAGKSVCRQNLEPCVGKHETQGVCHADVVVDDEDRFALTLVHERITRLQAFLQLAYTVLHQTVKTDLSLSIDLRRRAKSGNLLSDCALFRRSPGARSRT